MRPGRLLCLTLAVFALSGCATDKPISSLSLFGKGRPLAAAISGPDVIQLQLALLERPIEDRFLKSELWQLADEQILPLERKAYIEEAGFRVGLVNGLNPSGLLTLLTSSRSCQIPWRQYTRAGNPTLYALGPTIAHCKIDRPGSSETLEFERANCFLQITPTMAPNNRVRLHCVPRIRYGEVEMVARPTEDGASHLLLQEQPVKDFEELAFDVTLEINQYMVIGSRSDRVGTLGWRCFWGGDEPAPVQRLLAVRTCRPSDVGEEPGDGDAKIEHVLSVARLASQPANR
jgi:hypothetical protein